MQKKITAVFFITPILALLITSCAWHLRGYQSVDQADSIAVRSLSLNADDIYTPLYRSFKIDYENRRIDLINTDKQPQLKLLNESVTTRILSLNTELDPAETEITYQVNYQINLFGQPPQFDNVRLYRSYTENKNRAAAHDNERNKLIIEMRHEAATRVLNQIHTLLNSSLPVPPP